MTYFLDFDRTLFDTDSFKKFIWSRADWQPYMERIRAVDAIPRDATSIGGHERQVLWNEIDAVFADGKLSFKEGELSQFVFPDALDFLKSKGKDVVVVTAGITDPRNAFQKAKVMSTGISFLVSKVEYVVGESFAKARAIKENIVNYSSPYYFVDDLVVHLDSVHAELPNVAVYEMRRDGIPGSGKYPAITNLHELPS